MLSESVIRAAAKTAEDAEELTGTVVVAVDVEDEE